MSSVERSALQWWKVGAGLRRARGWISLFLLATVVALGVRLWIVEGFRLSSSSMYPTLLEGDLFLISKFAYSARLPFSSYELLTWRRPRRGEVVAFSLPDRGLDTFIKRVVALEGESVAIRDGKISVNGITLEYRDPDTSAAPAPSPEGQEVWEEGAEGDRYSAWLPTKGMADFGPVDVPPGHFFALGDNRADSVDSRRWGPVPYSLLRGRVAFVGLSVAPGGGLRSGRWGIWMP